MSYIAEYLWIDGTKPSAKIRSKAKVIADSDKPGIWGFDGSSTNQATGESSDVVLSPVMITPDPIRGGDNKLVLCETLLTDMTPHPTNTRSKCAVVAEKYSSFETWFGLEQEYTFFEGGQPLGWPENGFPAPQGGYYCGVGADEIFGREVVNKHLQACIDLGITLTGTNAEVMAGQWEFQIGPVGAPKVGDEIWLARWLLQRIGEDINGPKGMPIAVSFDAKPVKGDWNGAGCHTNFSTKQMRSSFDACENAAKALGSPGKPELHIANYGQGVEDRLTGAHETAKYSEYSYGISNRGASIRIPWQVARDGKGYIEDRRPNANCDPYLVTQIIIDTVCSEATK